MEKKVLEEIKRINGLMVHENRNVLEEKTLILEGSRNDIFERFFKVVFSDAGDNILRNADEGFSVLQKQADELVAAQKMTKQQADEAMSMVKKYIDDLKVASGDVNKVVDNLPKRGTPEAIHIKVNLKKFLNLLDDTIVSKMRRQILKNLRGTPDYVKWANYYQNQIFSSLVAEYEQRAGKGGFKISKDEVKKQFANKMKYFDNASNNKLWANTPEFYDDVAEYSQKSVDEFFNGTTYNGMGLKILKKSVGDVIDGYKTLDDVAPLTDEETEYLNEQYRIKNGVLGDIRLSISELYSKMKGYNKEIGEIVDDTFRQMAEVEKLFKSGEKMYTAQVLLVKIQENLKKINTLDSAAKLSFTDWVNKNITNDNLKKLFTESSPGEAISKVGVQNGSSADDVVNNVGDNVGDNVNDTPVENIDTWQTWWKEARREYRNARNELTLGFTKKIGDLMLKSVPFGKGIQKYGKQLQTIKAATDEAEKKGLLRLFAEWSTSGTMGLTREYGEYQKYLPGLEPIINLLGVINPRFAGANTRRQVYKRLVQLGAQYTYSFIFWTIVTAAKNAILGAILLAMKDPDTTLGQLGLYDILNNWFPSCEKIIEDYRRESSSICFYNSNCGEFQTQSTGIGLAKAFASNFIQEFTKYGEEVYKVAGGGPSWSTLKSILPGWVDNVLIKVFFESKDRAEAEIKLSQEKKDLEESTGEVIEVIKTNDDGTKERVKVLTDPTAKLKGNTREWWLRLVVARKWNAEKIKGPIQDTHEDIKEKTGLNVWAADYSGQNNMYVFNKKVRDNLYYFFKLSNDLSTPQYKVILKNELDSPDIWEKIKDPKTWIDIEKAVKDLNDVQENIEQRTQNVNINDSIYNKRNNLIMERKIRRLFEDEEKFGENKFEHWYSIFKFEKYDEKNGEFKEIDNNSLKQTDVQTKYKDFLKTYDSDDAFVRAVIDTHPDVMRFRYLKNQANINESHGVLGLGAILQYIRESKGEYVIFTVDRPADGNWRLVKGNFNKKELANMQLTKQIPPEKQPRKKGEDLESLKKKELTSVQKLKSNEKEGLGELPTKVKQKVLEKLRNGWGTETPYDFFSKFYSVSDINTVFNGKLKIYKLNPTKEFFESLVQNSPRIFIRKGFCKSLDNIKNQEDIGEKGKRVVNHILQKCQTKFKGEYGVKQIKTN